MSHAYFNRSTLNRQGLLALAYFVTGWLGLQLPYAGSHITLVWLPTGIAVAAAFRWGRVIWPGIYLGAFLVNRSIGSSLPLAAAIAIGNTLAPLLCVAYLKRVGFQPTFSRQGDVRSFLAGAALGMFASATLGVGSLHVAGLLPWGSIGFAGLSWWMGDTVGVLLAAPLLLTLNRKSVEQLRRVHREWLLWALITCPTVWLVFIHPYDPEGRALPLAFLTLPLLTWASLRFGTTGTALAGLVVAVPAAWATAMGQGLFHVPSLQLGLLLLWGYMATVILTSLLIMALQAERLQVENDLRASEEKLRGLFELSPLGIALTDKTGQFIEFNGAFQTISGYSAAELKALDYWALTPRAYEAAEAAQLKSLEVTSSYGPYEKEYIRKNGRLVPVRLNGMLVRQADGQDCIWSLVEDISDRRRLEADLRIAATAFDSREAMIVTDANERILRINRAFTDITGYVAEECLGRTPRMFASGRHDAAFYKAMWASIHQTGGWQGEVWDRRKNGEVYPKWLTISAVKREDGAVTHYIGTHFDITERKNAEEKINALAFFDQLTGLPNRTLLLDRMKQAITASARSECHGAILFIDLDHFKTLNDTLGHDMGDLLLKQVAQRLKACVREGDTVARLGGDEFVVVLPDLSPNAGEAARGTEAVAEKILAALNDGFHLGGSPHVSTASLGATLFLGKEASVDDLMKQADLAMYRSKGAGRNALRFFDPEMESAVKNRVSLETDLRDAISEGQLFLHYQPQIGEGGRLTGAEVLARWQHPRRGLVPPSEFIPLAEDSGLILPLGQWVMETACEQLARWARDPHMAHLDLAVNVSPHQFRHPGFVDQLLQTIHRTGVNPARIKLELTEGLLVNNPEEVAEKMQVLGATGMGFALDDFGTGYSSLSYLKRMPFDLLKVDQSFIRDLMSDPNDAAIVKAILALAHNLGLGVIAEGVETEAQHNCLAHLGCRSYQGFFFSHPLSVGGFEGYAKRG